MARVRTYTKWIGSLALLLVVVQFALPFLFRNTRMRNYLRAHLERSFGRPVQAQDYSMQLLPFPRVDVMGVTVGENPAFGNEYFLRADRLTASVRWLSLLRGHFDFGTISLSRPSLILVRNAQGRWNLEGWLPPPASAPSNARYTSGSQSSPEATNHLEKIEFDEGRINFKQGDEKSPFAFTLVSGSVDQVAPGRWELRLEAQPWRSGVPLQSTGTLQIRGEIAGTSSRLQPASLRIHWDKVSIADLFRMATGNDFGIRGDFALDANASVGQPGSGENSEPGLWKFELHGRSRQIHRWDLTERSDNPAIDLNLKGLWDLARGEATAESLSLDLPHSHFQGKGSLQTTDFSDWQLAFENTSLQAQDLLAWYRAFHSDVAEEVSASQFFTGHFALRGWPLTLENLQLASDGGNLKIPGLSQPLRIGLVQSQSRGGKFELLPVRFNFGPSKEEELSRSKADKSLTTKANSSPQVSPGQGELSFQEDLAIGNGSVHLNGKFEDAATLLKACAALGKSINHGWEMTGPTSLSFSREWDGKDWRTARWNGAVIFNKAQLQAAGLNLPIKLEDTRLEWKDGKRSASVGHVEAFGANWTGTISETPPLEGATDSTWKFQLRADHLDAADLDRWFGPRARPNWLQRLLPSLLGNSSSNAEPSELLRRVSADGDLSVESLTIEKMNFTRTKASISFHELKMEIHDAEATWAGGIVHGTVNATFSAPPKYEIIAELDKVNLSQFALSPHWADRWAASANAQLHLTTTGIGREALLSQLIGSGNFHLKSPEIHGWDIPASLDSGTIRAGTSHWQSAEGAFLLKDSAVEFERVTLLSPQGQTRLAGTIDFLQQLRLEFSREPNSRPAPHTSEPSRRFFLQGSVENPQTAIQTGAPSLPKP